MICKPNKLAGFYMMWGFVESISEKSISESISEKSISESIAESISVTFGFC